MEKQEQQFWYRFSALFFAIVAFSACGKKAEPTYQEAPVHSEQAVEVQPVPESENPEMYAKGNAVADTNAYFNPDEPTVFGITLTDNQSPDGALITQVIDNSQASKFDLQPNDVILKINDIPTPTAKDFERIYHSASSKIAVEVTLLRNGDVRNVDIVTQ